MQDEMMTVPVFALLIALTLIVGGIGHAVCAQAKVASLKRTRFLLYVLLMLLLVLAGYAQYGRLHDVITKQFFEQHKPEIKRALHAWYDSPQKLIHVLNRQIEAHPDDTTAKRLLANAYLRTAAYQKAYLTLKPLYSKKIVQSEIKLMMAETLIRLHKKRQALLILKKLVADRTSNYQTLWISGHLAHQEGYHKLALIAWRFARAKLVAQSGNTDLVDSAIDQLVADKK